MGKLKLKYQIEFDKYLKSLNNSDLLDFVIECQSPDDYDGEFSGQGAWMADYSVIYLKERLEEWLK